MAIKLYFAVVDMAGEPGMAEVEHPEDCYEEDAYVCLADYDVQTARIKELEAEREHDALALADLVTELQNVLPAVKVLKVRCEALEWLREVVNFRENGPGFGGLTADDAAEEFDFIFDAALRATGK